MDHKKMYAELLLGVLGNKVLKEITIAEDSEEALLKALLYLIYLTDEHPSPAKHFFVQGLLNSFPFLQDSLIDYSYPLVEDIKVKVVLDKDGSSLVTIKQEYIERLSDQIENDPATIKSVPPFLFDAFLKFYGPYFLE